SAAPLPCEPEGNVGSLGTFVAAGGPDSWLDPAALRLVVAYARDAYIGGQFAFAAQVLLDYRATLNDLETSTDWSTTPVSWTHDFVQLGDEIDAMLDRLASNRDFFGNPAGWAPMLSLEVNEGVYSAETDRAIRILYLVYWLRHAAASVAARLQALSLTRDQLR